MARMIYTWTRCGSLAVATTQITLSLAFHQPATKETTAMAIRIEPFQQAYSLRRASMGSSIAARRAG